MTRDEFIDGYMKRSGLSSASRTEDGFQIEGTQRRYALPCACGYETCEGWAMVGAESAADHMALYAP